MGEDRGDQDPEKLIEQTVPGQAGGDFYRPAGASATTPLQLAKGDLVGDFELVELIGQGGMGQVWRAIQPSLGGRHVALKFLRGDPDSSKALAFFEREARAGGRLNHPGIVTVFAHGRVSGHPWIAMEYVDGHWDLGDYLLEVAAGEQLPDDYDHQVALFISRVADAMQCAHSAGVIHRDLKPRNILVRPDSSPAVSDFGLARIVDETELSHTGDFAGTYAYMSPEQVAARRAGIDHRTDVFSLGAILYEMLTLQRPFKGETTHEVAQEILVKRPPELRSVRRSVPDALSAVCFKALEKDRDRRYSTMAEFGQDLRSYLQKEPVEALRNLEDIAARRRRRVAWSLGTPLLVATLALLGAEWFRRDSDAQAGSTPELQLLRPSEVGLDSMHPRSEWSVEELQLQDLEPMGEINRLTLHWSADPGARVPSDPTDVIEMMRSVESKHVRQQDFAAVGYHYFVDGQGEIWEGRPLQYRGAHAGGVEGNAGNIGVCVLAGRDAVLAPERLTDLRRFLDLLREAHGIEAQQVLAHSQLKNTSCPGEQLTEFLASYVAGR